jgi:hypothetical protein
MGSIMNRFAYNFVTYRDDIIGGLAIIGAGVLGLLPIILPVLVDMWGPI